MEAPMMLKSATIVLAALVASAASAQTVKVTIPNHGANFAPVMIAEDKGYFKEEGLDVEVIVSGGGTATPALISGDIQYSSSPASAMSAILKGAALKVTLVGQVRPNYQIWSFDPAVKTVEDLKGKSLAVISRGDSQELAARLFFMSRGFGKDDVGYNALGPGLPRVAAITGGAQRYGVLLRPDIAQLRQTGALDKGTMIADLTKLVEMQMSGIVTSEKEVTANRDRSVKFTRAIRKGQAFMRAFTEESVDIVHKRAPKLDRAAIKEDLLGSVEDQNVEGSMSMAAANKEISLRGELLGMAPDKIMPAEKVYDFSVVADADRTLRAAGWKPVK
jgi:ABC-type nitrate/sulfonate/bicarbonate transport system substrate-binding protein